MNNTVVSTLALQPLRFCVYLKDTVTSKIVCLTRFTKSFIHFMINDFEFCMIPYYCLDIGYYLFFQIARLFGMNTPFYS